MPIPHLKKIIVQQNIQRSNGGIFSYHPRGRRRRPRRGKLSPKRLLSYALIVFCALFVAGSISFLAMFAVVARSLPDPDKLSVRALSQTTRIYDRTGKIVLYEIHGEEKRTVVDLKDISQPAIAATIVAEDKDFYAHRGFDLRAIARAFYKNLIKGELAQGGSTITQQFIKNSVLSPEKTFSRKFKELVLSLEVERRYSKDQILKLYLNEIPYGSVSYGIESAAQTFFGKSAKDLTVSEGALLAALPKAPTYYSPYGSRRNELAARKNHIIDLMAEQGYISPEEAASAKEDDVLGRVRARKETIVAAHFVFYVREFLADQFGDQEVERGGLKVTTTLDVDQQKKAEETIQSNRPNLKRWGAATAGMMSLNPNTGEILSMVGSADYFDESISGKFNAMTGLLQPGSSIKPAVYAAAFEKGYTPSAVLDDAVTTFQKEPKEYTPHDYDLGERGPVTMKEALAGSLNIPAVKTLYLAGMNRFIDFAERLGYTTFADRSRLGLSLVLGGGEVKPVEHIAAFSAFAAEGVLSPTKAVLKVEDKNGKILFDATSKSAGRRVMDAEIARQINDILSDNSARTFIFGETNFLTLPDRPVAAKTGTTNDFKGAWTIGYTPSLVAGVWVGNPDGSEMKKGADGSKVAAPIWNAFMKNALAGMPAENFTAPQPIVTGKPILDGVKNTQAKVKIDRITGKLATQYTPPDYIEERGFGIPHSILYFVSKDDPRGSAPEHPEADPQFEFWETAIAEWTKKQNIVIGDPPTLYDDIHIPENFPTVAITAPQDGQTIMERAMFVSVSASARRGVYRVEFLLDGEVLGQSDASGVERSISIPNRFAKGFHTLTAKAYDDVGNSAESTANINLTADPGPLGIRWISPWNFETLSASRQFPFTIQFSLDDPKSIRELKIAAKRADGTEQTIGVIQNPSLPNVSMEWKNAPPAGTYALRAEALLSGGDLRSEEIAVKIE